MNKIKSINGRDLVEIMDTIGGKLTAASVRIECGASRTIINLNDEELTVLFWALDDLRKSEEGKI